jgi:AraC-like DNA-binding protein
MEWNHIRPCLLSPEGQTQKENGMKENRLQRDLFRQLLLELEVAGIKPERLFSQSRLQGVEGSSTNQAALGGEEAFLLLEMAVKLTGDPTLAIRLGQQVGIASYGAFGFALMSCASLREAVQLLLRYGQVFFQPRWISYEHEGGLLLRANIAWGNATQRQLVTELIFSQFSTVGSALYRNNVESAEVRLSYSRPSHSASYKTAFPGPVTFDCEHTEVFIPARLLDTPVKTANRSEHVVFHQQCEEMLRGLNSVEKTTAAVRQLLIQSAGDFLDIAQVAESLHVSERTLRRRLEAESTSFRSTFEEIRDLLAREYLAETELTVAEIAHLLDYSETVNFRRAFVRWNGVTPSEYRQRQLAETDSQGIIGPV